MSQNSMRNRQKKYRIDERNGTEIRKRIGELASFYTPEWNFTEENPDIGSTIGILFSEQMEDNIDRYNQVLEKYHTEFVNFLDISLKPAKPAKSVVLLNLIQDSIPGAWVPKGTKLLTDSDIGDMLVFETDTNVYVTNSTIKDAFMTDVKDGEIIPIKGNFESIPIVSPEQIITDEEATPAPEEEVETEEPEEEMPNVGRSFTLFGEDGGIEKNALLFYHELIFDVVDEDIYVKLRGNAELMEKIKEGAFSFLYYCNQGLVPFDYMEFRDETTIILRKSAENKKLRIDGKAYSLIALVANEPIRKNYEMEEVLFSTVGKPVDAEAVNNGATDFEVTNFEPFSDTLSLYSECYIGHDSYFSKANALITLGFDVSYPEHRMQMTMQQINDELKIIKKKPRSIATEAMAEAYAEEISIEYYNGIGWKKLNCRQNYKTMFSMAKQGHYEISFICPKDWRETDMGAYQGRCLRIQLLKSDNCYLRPAVHYYPKLKNLKVSFSYEKQYVPANCVVGISGTKKVLLTKKAKERGKFVGFSPTDYNEDALYLGFDKKMENGPISLLFTLKDGNYYEGIKTVFEYYTLSGFKQMKVIDYTQDFSRSGIVLFMPPSDMQALVLEGKRRYWIRIRRMQSSLVEEYHATLPVIVDIRVNAAMVSNIETGQPQDFYLEDLLPFMHFKLAADNILDTTVWVNEKGYLTPVEVAELVENSPERVQVEYDILGEVFAVYVKWDETESFDESENRRVYMIDRMNNEIIFGDGVHTDIPRVMDDVAFRVTVRCCNGAYGNVGEGMIVDSVDQLTYIGEISNPVKAFGGSNIEDLESALERGANILRSRKRLVSVDDYSREIRGFSDIIDQVKCITGRLRDGSYDEKALSFVLLLKDYMDGAFSFHGLSGQLRKHLLENCELTVSENDIHIVEPIFVDVSVELWVKSVELDDSFEIQNLLQDYLTNYLNPLQSEAEEGWKIGTLPKKKQLLLKLTVLKSRAIVKKLVMIAKYTDETGAHERDLEDVKVTPFMVCRSGVHHVHIMLNEK